jgi:hypothetical protein
MVSFKWISEVKSIVCIKANKMGLSRFQVHCLASDNQIFPTEATFRSIDLDSDFDNVPRGENGFFWLSAYMTKLSDHVLGSDNTNTGTSTWREFCKTESGQNSWIDSRARIYTIKDEFMSKIYQINSPADYHEFVKTYGYVEGGAIEWFNRQIYQAETQINEKQKHLDAVELNLNTHYKKFVAEQKELTMTGNLRDYPYKEIPSKKNPLGSYYGAIHRKNTLITELGILIDKVTFYDSRKKYSQTFCADPNQSIPDPNSHIYCSSMEVDFHYDKIIADGWVGIFYSREFFDQVESYPKPMKWYPEFLRTECMVCWKWIFEDEESELLKN